MTDHSRIAPAHWRVGRLLTGADLVTPSVTEEALVGLAGPMAVVEQLESSATASGLPAGYVGAVIQAQLDVAIELGLGADPGASATAFDAVWQGLTRVLVGQPPEPAGSTRSDVITTHTQSHSPLVHTD